MTRSRPTSTRPPRGAAPAWDERLDELGERYPEAVVSLVAPDGFPFSVRVPDRRGPRRRAESAWAARRWAFRGSPAWPA